MTDPAQPDETTPEPGAPVPAAPEYTAPEYSAPDAPAPDGSAPDDAAPPIPHLDVDASFADEGEGEPVAWWVPEPGERLLWSGGPSSLSSLDEPADRVAVACALLAPVAGVASCVRLWTWVGSTAHWRVSFDWHWLPAILAGVLVAVVISWRLLAHRRWLWRLQYAITDRRIVITAGRFDRSWRHEALPRPFAVPRREGLADVVFGVFTSAPGERELRSYLDAGTDELRTNPWPVLLRLDLEVADRLVAAYA